MIRLFQFLFEQKMNILVFDIETNGLPKSRKYPFDFRNFDNARMLELAYVILNTKGEIIKQVSHLIKHDIEIKIQNSYIHGIDMDMIQQYGTNIEEVLDELHTCLDDVDTIVAHNIQFDFNIILSELYRKYHKYMKTIGMLYTKTQVCTMLKGKKYMRIPKFPKLVDLYKHIFNENYEQKHRALDDVMLCTKCYIEMLE